MMRHRISPYIDVDKIEISSSIIIFIIINYLFKFYLLKFYVDVYK